MKKNNSTLGLFQLGLIASLGLVLSGFEYAEMSKTTKKIQTKKITEIEDEFIPDITQVEKPELPQPEKEMKAPSNPVVTPPTPVVGEIIPSDITPDDGQRIGDSDAEVVIAGGIGHQEIVIEKKFFDATLMKEFPTYEEFVKIKDKEVRRTKTEAKLNEKIRLKCHYPEMERSIGKEGTVYVSFIVDKEGNITNATIVIGATPNFDKEALRAVNQLPKMIPGKDMDKPVDVLYTIPVNFKLKH